MQAGVHRSLRASRMAGTEMCNMPEHAGLQCCSPLKKRQQQCCRRHAHVTARAGRQRVTVAKDSGYDRGEGEAHLRHGRVLCAHGEHDAGEALERRRHRVLEPRGVQVDLEHARDRAARAARAQVRKNWEPVADALREPLARRGPAAGHAPLHLDLVPRERGEQRHDRDAVLHGVDRQAVLHCLQGGGVLGITCLQAADVLRPGHYCVHSLGAASVARESNRVHAQIAQLPELAVRNRCVLTRASQQQRCSAADARSCVCHLQLEQKQNIHLHVEHAR